MTLLQMQEISITDLIFNVNDECECTFNDFISSNDSLCIDDVISILKLNINESHFLGMTDFVKRIK